MITSSGLIDSNGQLVLPDDKGIPPQVHMVARGPLDKIRNDLKACYNKAFNTGSTSCDTYFVFVQCLTSANTSSQKK